MLLKHIQNYKNMSLMNINIIIVLLCTCIILSSSFLKYVFCRPIKFVMDRSVKTYCTEKFCQRYHYMYISLVPLNNQEQVRPWDPVIISSFPLRHCVACIQMTSLHVDFTMSSCDLSMTEPRFPVPQKNLHLDMHKQKFFFYNSVMAIYWQHHYYICISNDTPDQESYQSPKHNHSWTSSSLSYD